MTVWCSFRNASSSGLVSSPRKTVEGFIKLESQALEKCRHHCWMQGRRSLKSHPVSHARRRRWNRFLKQQDVKYRQYSNGVENGEADEPRDLIIARALPHGDQLPHSIPDCDDDQGEDEEAQQWRFHICVNQCQQGSFHFQINFRRSSGLVKPSGRPRSEPRVLIWINCPLRLSPGVD